MPTVWRVCVDDSCDERREKYVCAGALLGDKDAWHRFNKGWRKALNRQPSIEYYHGKEVHRLTGQFRQFRDKNLYPPPAGMDAAIAKREGMRRAIEASDLIGFGVGVLVPVYRDVRESHPRGKTFMAEDPFEYILQELVYRTTKEIAENVGAVEVSFVSDRSNRSRSYENVYAEWKKWNPNTAVSMRAITHEDDEKHYGLQAADLAASSVNSLFRAHVDTGEVPQQYALSQRFWRIGNIDKRYLLKMLDHQTPRESERLKEIKRGDR